MSAKNPAAKRREQLRRFLETESPEESERFAAGDPKSLATMCENLWNRTPMPPEYIFQWVALELARSVLES